jgi:hypothetical protein
VGFADRPRALASGEEYVRTARLNIPAGLVGPFYVFVAADSGAAVSEGGSEANNVAYGSTAVLVRLQPPADLVVGTITIPTNAVAGQSVTLTYTVRNAGSNTASGSWVDSIYFSDDDQWDLDDALFARVTHSGSVPPAGSYTETVTAPLPGLVPGDYHVIVRSDIRNQLPESNETNNLAASLDAISIDVPELPLGTPVNGQLGQGQFVFYKVIVTPAETLVIDFDSTSATAFNEIYVRYGALPTRSQHDFLYNRPNEADQSITVPITQGGTYYIAAYGNSGLPAPASFTITARILPFGLTRISPASGGNVGEVTVRIDGALFDPFTGVQLVGHGRTNEAVWLRRIDQTRLHATFDLRGLPPGAYDVRVYSEQLIDDLDPVTHEIIEYIAVYGDETATNAFTVEAGGGARVLARMSLPGSARFGSRFTFHVEVANEGNTDLPVPVYQVSSPNSTPFSSFPDFRSGRGSQEQIVVLGGMRPEVLAPGERVIVPLYATAVREPTSRFRLQSLASLTGPIDWDALEQNYRDDSDEQTWRRTWSNFKSLIGSTGPELQATLATLATQIAPSQGQRYLTGNRLTLELLARARQGRTTLAPLVARAAPAAAAFQPAGGGGRRDRDRRRRPRPDSPTACTAVLSTAELLATEAYARSTCLPGLYLVFGSEVGDLWNLYISSDSAHPAGTQFFGDGDAVGQGFKNSATTKDFLDTVAMVLESVIARKVNTREIDCSQGTTKPLSDLLPNALLHPMLNFDQVFEIPGNIAGGISGPGDTRELKGNVSIRPVKDKCGKITSLEVTANYQMAVNDVVDFCPGGLGASIERLCTVPFAALEANDWAYDVPFQVNFTPEPGMFCIPAGKLPEDCNKKKCPQQPPGPCDPPCNEDACDMSGSPDGGEDCCENGDCDDDDVPTVRPRDPNDIVGPAGFGSERWVATSQALGYTIRFENDPRLATAPAQVVRITQQLDPHLDFRTFRLGDLGFGTHRVTVPENRSFFQTMVDLQETHGILLEIAAGINVTTGEAFWQLTSIDPQTGDVPANPLAGFLPVNTKSPAGEGFVSYTIRPRSDAQNGEVVNAQARIIFDINEPIDTPPIFNTLDASAPSSAVQPLLALGTNTTFLVSWAGTDPDGGSAIAGYDIYVATDDGPYQLWLANTPNTSAYALGERGHRYAFYSVARDNAGNREAPPPSADALTRISDNLAPVLAPIANYVIGVGSTLIVTNMASDANLPPQSLRFNLAPGAPVGATIRSTNGLLRWTPQPIHAGAAHVLTVLVNDNGEPPLTSAQTFTVTVPNHVEIGVGSTVVRGGETGAVPIRIFSSTSLTGLFFTLEVPAGRLSSPTIVARSPQIDSAEALLISETQWIISLGGVTPVQLPGEQPTVTLGFTALDVPPSAFLPLVASGIHGMPRDGSPPPTAAGLPGRVTVVVGSRPLVEMSRETNSVPQLLLLGNAGARYAVESSPSLNPAIWSVWWEGQLFDYIQSFSNVATNGPAQFFRARAIPPNP